MRIRVKAKREGDSEDKERGDACQDRVTMLARIKLVY